MQEVRIDQKRKYWHDMFFECGLLMLIITGIAFVMGGVAYIPLLFSIAMFMISSQIKYKFVKTGEVWKRV